MRRHKFNSLRKFEKLEDRRMMTGDISFNEDNGVLTITGAGFDDEAVVRFEGNEVTVDLVATEDDGDGTDHTDQTENIADVFKIVFNGFAGDDKLTVFVDGLDQGVSVNNVVLEFNGGANDDTLIQNNGGIRTTALGDSGNDTLEGSRFNDILNGGAGNDTYVFDGRNLGSDEIHEAANVDTDTLDFTNFESFVSVDLSRVFSASTPSLMATAFMSNLQLKQFNATGIEDVIGSASTDTIRGNSRPNHFWGNGEDDKLEGRGGNDILEGGTGSDIYEFIGTSLGTDDIIEAANSDNDGLRFSGMSAGVNVDISKAGADFAVNSAALRLRLANDTAIEKVWGSRFGDVITGNSRDNTLLGLDGNDTIRGGLGVDTLNGGADDDVLLSDALDEAVFGGTGNDRFDNFFLYETILNARDPNPGRFKDLGLI